MIWDLRHFFELRAEFQCVARASEAWGRAGESTCRQRACPASLGATPFSAWDGADVPLPLSVPGKEQWTLSHVVGGQEGSGRRKCQSRKGGDSAGRRSRPAASAALQSQAGPQATTDSGQRFGLSLTSQMAAEARGDFDHSRTVTGPAMVSSDQQHSQRAPPFQAQCVCNLDKNKTNDCT